MHTSAGTVRQDEVAWLEEAMQPWLQHQLRPYTLLWHHLAHFNLCPLTHLPGQGAQRLKWVAVLLKPSEARLHWQLNHHTVLLVPSVGKTHALRACSHRFNSVAHSPWMPVYLWGMPVFRVTYSTRHTCTLPLLLPDAIVCPSSQAVQARILPPAAQQQEQQSA